MVEDRCEFCSKDFSLVWLTGLANSPATPRRYLAYTAAFSRKHTLQQVYDFLCSKLRFCREDIRLWKISSKDEVVNHSNG